jgi:hypothetical protein
MESRTPCNLPWGDVGIHELQLIKEFPKLQGKKGKWSVDDI